MSPPISPVASSDHSKFAILATLAGMAAFTVSDTVMKLAATTLPVGQTIALRGLVAAILMTALARTCGELRIDRGLLQPAFLLRTAGEIGASIFIFLALARMPIIDVTAILQFLPLALTGASALFLREPVGWRRWLATAAGLAGVLLIVRPGTDHFGWASLLALGSVASVTLRDLTTRRISAAIPSMTVAWATAIAVMCSGIVLDPPASWNAPDPRTWVYLAAAGIAVCAGNLMIISSVRAAPISLIAPFRYSAVLFALVSGYFVWRELPDALTATGIAIVTTAGLYTFHRERVRRR
jgi:drug/metabolite transporter (DMT)-like permease